MLCYTGGGLYYLQYDCPPLLIKYYYVIQIGHTVTISPLLKAGLRALKQSHETHNGEGLTRSAPIRWQ